MIWVLVTTVLGRALAQPVMAHPHGVCITGPEGLEVRL
jgi:hypothetical protein